MAYPSMAWSRWNESGVRRINASQAVTSQLDTFFCSLLLLPDLSHNSWLAASRSGAGGIGLAITTTSYDYTIRCTCEPTVGKGWEEWMEKKKEERERKTAPLSSVEDNQTTIRKIGSEPDQIEMSEWQGGPVVKVGAGGGWRATRGRAMQHQNPAWRGIYLPTLVARGTGGSPMQMHGMGMGGQKGEDAEEGEEGRRRTRASLAQHQHQRALGLETHTHTHTTVHTVHMQRASVSGID